MDSQWLSSFPNFVSGPVSLKSISSKPKWKSPSGKGEVEKAKWKRRSGKGEVEKAKWKSPNGKVQMEKSKCG
jgi:hypothetical protein